MSYYKNGIGVTKMALEKPQASPILTPTFQSVLNTNLLMATERLNNGTLFEAYEIIRTIIDMLKEEDRKPLVENDVTHINAKIRIAMRIQSVDLYQTRRKQRGLIQNVLRQNVRPLFRKLMLTLHTQGYLEKQRLGPRRPSTSHLEWQGPKE